MAIECYERAGRGETAATRSVIHGLRPRLERMAAYYAHRTGEDADDLLQEAWLGLLEALPRLDVRIGSPDQYLVQRARWRLLDAVKRARLRRCEPLDDDVADAGADPAAEASLAEWCVQAFCRELAPTQQAVLLLLLSGFTWREAGSMLGCTSANVAYHVRRIRLKYVQWAATREAGRGCVAADSR